MHTLFVTPEERMNPKSLKLPVIKSLIPLERNVIVIFEDRSSSKMEIILPAVIIHANIFQEEPDTIYVLPQFSNVIP